MLTYLLFTGLTGSLSERETPFYTQVPSKDSSDRAISNLLVSLIVDVTSGSFANGAGERLTGCICIGLSDE